MNIYKISQTFNNDYDTYDSAIVAAETEEVARNISPSGHWNKRWGGWCQSPDQVEVELIGVAREGIEAGVIVASFNAG